MICELLLIYNLSTDPWNEQDQKHLDAARKRCGKLFKTDPCVSRFFKQKKLQYKVLCGPAKAESES